MEKLVLICLVFYVNIIYPQIDKSIEDIANDFISTLSPDLRKKLFLI